MPIETDIKAIKKHHQKTTKSLKEIASWQVHHEVDDSARFKEILDAMAQLPDKESITKAIEDSVKTTVNGKIDKIAAHLAEQDEDTKIVRGDIKTLSDKISPIDKTRTWLQESVKVILYVGGIAVALIAIIEVLKVVKVIN